MKATKPKQLRKGWSFINGEERNREHPDRFHIPDLAERLAIEAGAIVKVGVEAKRGGERFWVKVVATMRKDSALSLIGEVDNPLFDNCGVDYGDRIEFGHANILDIYADREKATVHP